MGASPGGDGPKGWVLSIEKKMADRNASVATPKQLTSDDGPMEWLMFALAAPVLPLVAIFGAWVIVRPSSPARGVVGVACNDAGPIRA